jgi:hypothetical protein
MICEGLRDHREINEVSLIGNGEWGKRANGKRLTANGERQTVKGRPRRMNMNQVDAPGKAH